MTAGPVFGPPFPNERRGEPSVRWFAEQTAEIKARVELSRLRVARMLAAHQSGRVL